MLMEISIVVLHRINAIHATASRATKHKAFFWLAVCFAIPTVHAQNPDTVYTQRVLAIQQQIESGDLDGARAAITSAEKQYPADGGLENLLGVVEVQQGHLGAARQEFLSAWGHGARLVGAYLNLTRIDMQTAATDAAVRSEALRMSEKIVQLDSANDEAHYQLATIFAWEKNYVRSVAELD